MRIKMKRLVLKGVGRLTWLRVRETLEKQQQKKCFIFAIFSKDVLNTKNVLSAEENEEK